MRQYTVTPWVNPPLAQDNRERTNIRIERVPFAFHDMNDSKAREVLQRIEKARKDIDCILSISQIKWWQIRVTHTSTTYDTLVSNLGDFLNS